MFRKDRALFFRCQLRELAASAQQVPRRPPPGWIEHGPPRPHEERFMKIGFVSERIGPPEHRVVRLRRQRLEGRLREQRPDHVHEVVRIGGDSQDRDTERIVEVLVDRASHGCARNTSRDRPDVAATAKRQQLHEQAVVGALRHAVLEAPRSLGPAARGGRGPSERRPDWCRRWLLD